MIIQKARGVTMYTEGASYKLLEDQTTGTGKKVLLSVLKHMESDLNTIIIGGDTLKSMINDTMLSESQIRNGISELRKLGLIEPTRQLRAEYIVDPTLAIKGNPNIVWKFYGALERSQGDTDASVLDTVDVAGKSLPMTEEDYAQVGRFYKKAK